MEPVEAGIDTHEIEVGYYSEVCLFSWRTVMGGIQVKDTFPYSIQFNPVYLYSPISHITNLSQSAFQSEHIDIPVPKPHIGAGKTPKQPFTGEKGRHLQESNRGGSLSRMDRCNRCNVSRRTD